MAPEILSTYQVFGLPTITLQRFEGKCQYHVGNYSADTPEQALVLAIGIANNVDISYVRAAAKLLQATK